jgi:hypothetical protein
MVHYNFIIKFELKNSHHQVIFMNEKFIYIGVGSSKKFTVKEKIQISAIESLTLSSLTDGYVSIYHLIFLDVDSIGQ